MCGLSSNRTQAANSATAAKYHQDYLRFYSTFFGVFCHRGGHQTSSGLNSQAEYDREAVGGQ